MYIMHFAFTGHLKFDQQQTSFILIITVSAK